MFSGYSQSIKNNHSLNITVTNFKNTKGSLRVCITDQKNNFLKDCLFSQIVSIEDDNVSLSFKNLKDGTYAVSVYHDENNNGILETIRSKTFIQIIHFISSILIPRELLWKLEISLR